MTTDDVRCVLLKIHGIGNQRPEWSGDFDAALTSQLTALELAAFSHQSVWWADLSRLPGPPAAAGLAPTGHTSSTSTMQAYVDYARYLMSHPASAASAITDLGSLIGNLVNNVMDLQDGLVSLADHVTDVANYVGNNGIRLSVQQRLMASLFAAQAAHPQAALILASHSQGTIISYDVLRLLARQLPALKVWVTMGCPLGWYLGGASWGHNEIDLPGTVRWINLYDRNDLVGRDLELLAQWMPTVPEDIDVDNVGLGLHPHDHWRNPVVVAQYVGLIRQALG